MSGVIQVNTSNPFPYSFDNKRYHTYNYFLKQRYHTKVAKVALNADFTCPNRDGTKAYGGCTFCSSVGSGDFVSYIQDSLITQFESGAAIMKRKWPDAVFIPYFQAFTNTYGDLETLKKRYELFLGYPDVVAIAIATRADCITEEIARYLADLATKIDIYIELGLQTIHDETAAAINRAHSYQDFLHGLNLCRQYDLNVCVHLINGLPGETRDMMLATAKAVGQLDIQALKIHSLYIIKGTAMATQYLTHPFPVLSREDYIDLVVEQLRNIPPEIVIERLTGDGVAKDVIAPLWSLNKTTILNDIDKRMKAENIVQGDLLHTPL